MEASDAAPADAKPDVDMGEPEPSDDDDVDATAREALDSLAEELTALEAIAAGLESRLAADGPTLASATLKDAATQIPVLDGNVDRLQPRIDAVWREQARIHGLSDVTF